MTESFNRKLGRLAQNVSGTGTITSNAATATAWQNARTITLDGDLSGNVSIDGTSNVTLTATVANNTVALGTDTTGNYVATIAAGSGITVTGSGSETAAVTVAIDNTVATLSGEQTLTNKTISGSTNTLSNIANGSLTNSTISGVSLGGTLNSLTMGTGVALNSGTTYDGSAAKTISIGQAVGTTDNVTFAGVTADNVRIGVTTAGEIDTSSGNLTLDSTGGITVMDDDVNVTGNLLVDGNLTVSGTTVTVNATNLAVEDNMIYLNNGSAVANPDLGFAGNYNDGTYRHAGVFRDASDGVWKFFHQYTPEPDASAYIDITHGSFALAPIQASTVTATTFTGTLSGAAPAGSLSGNTLASGVTASSLTSVGTLTSLSVSGDLTVDTNTLYVDATNNRVGIGTATPGSTLDVTLGTTSTDVFRFGASSRWAFRNGSDLRYLVFGRRDLGAGAKDIFQFDSDDGSLAVDTNTLYVDATNNRVGIGTASPGYKLDIANDAADSLIIRSNNRDGHISLHRHLGTLASPTVVSQGAGLGRIYFKGYGGSDYRIGAYIGALTDIGSDISDINMPGCIAFATSPSGSVTAVERVRIDSNGNLGIGTTAPATKLHVNGAITIGSDGDRFKLSDEGTYRQIQTYSSQNLAINPLGNNVGIGTTNPGGYKLYVEGSFRAVSSVYTGGSAPLSFQYNGNDGTYNQTTIYANQNNNSNDINNGIFIERGRLTDSASAEIRNFVVGARGGSTQFVVTGPGNVGIGITNPGYKLEVNGTAGFGSTINIPADTWIRTSAVSLIRDSYFGYSAAYRAVQVGVSGGTRAISLGVDLTTNASGNFNGKEIVIPNNTAIIAPVAANNSYIGVLRIDTSNNLCLGGSAYTTDGHIYINNSSGNVGIGTTGPGSRLHLYSDTGTNITIRGANGNVAAGVQLNHGGGGGRTQVDGEWYMSFGSAETNFGNTPNLGGGLVFWYNGSTGTISPMTLKRTGTALFRGNVGIGTTNPTRTLDVNGTINTRLIVSENLIAGQISANIPASPSYILICNLNMDPGFSLAGTVNAASWTCWNISTIWIRKDYQSTTANAGVTGLYKNGCDFSIVDMSYSGGRFIALRFTSNPEIDVMFTGYGLPHTFTGGVDPVIVTSGVTVNSTLASY